MLVLQILLIAVNIAMAWLHDRKIAKHKRIKHFIGGWSYFILVSAASLYFLLDGDVVTKHHIEVSVIFFLCSLLQRKVVFDCALSLFRDLPLFYVSHEPRGKSLWEALDNDISIIDWVHYKLFGTRSEVYVIVYLLLWLLGTVYLLNV